LAKLFIGELVQIAGYHSESARTQQNGSHMVDLTMRLGDLTTTLRLLRLRAEGHLETDAPEPALSSRLLAGKRRSESCRLHRLSTRLILRSRGARE
jgi:hypothetical protein